MTPASIKVSIPGTPAQPGAGGESRPYVGCSGWGLNTDTRDPRGCLFPGTTGITLPKRVQVPDATTSRRDIAKKEPVWNGIRGVKRG
ncbi:hypothetical protein DSECCO2_526330 [anaerobic digester metagenome]